MPDRQAGDRAQWGAERCCTVLRAGTQLTEAEASVALGLGDFDPHQALPATTPSTRLQTSSLAEDCFQLEELTMSCFQRVF